MRFFIGILAALGSIFAQEPKSQPLNTAVITFAQTYYAPAVTSPDILPGSYKNLKATIVDTEPKEKSVAQEPKPTPPPPPAPAPVVTPPPAPPPPAPPAPVGDPYLAKPEPVINWLKMDSSFMGDGFETPQPREFSPITIDREYWKIDVWAYWVSINPAVKTPVEQDYFKIEVYEVGNNTPIFSATAGTEEGYHVYQSFKKPGKYYFKTYTKPISKYELNIYVSSTLAK